MNMLFWDYGGQIRLAQKMAETFQTVFYHNPTAHDGFEDVRDVKMATGINELIKIKEWVSVLPQIDIAIFTDCYEPIMQQYLEDLGIPVFGSGMSSRLETDRLYLKEVIASVGLPIGKYEVVDGIDYLEYVLKEKEDVYIKSDHRKNHETTKWKSWKLSKGELRRMRKDMGVFGMNERYIIEDKLDSIAEIGADLFIVDGRYPSKVLCGVESKDCCYLAKFMAYSEMPKQLKDVTDKMAPIYADLGYRGQHSNEVIIGRDKEGYLLDETNRCGQPPTDAMCNAISNYAECVAMVAEGIVPIVRNEYDYLCQLILKSEIATIDDIPLIVPEQFKKFVSIKNLYIDNEGTWVYSRRGQVMSEIGSISGYGSTLKEAIEMATEIFESIESEDAYVEFSGVEAGLDSLKRLAKAGIKFFL